MKLAIYFLATLGILFARRRLSRLTLFTCINPTFKRKIASQLQVDIRIPAQMVGANPQPPSQSRQTSVSELTVQ